MPVYMRHYGHVWQLKACHLPLLKEKLNCDEVKDEELIAAKDRISGIRSTLDWSCGVRGIGI